MNDGEGKQINQQVVDGNAIKKKLIVVGNCEVSNPEGFPEKKRTGLNGNFGRST